MKVTYRVTFILFTTLISIMSTACYANENFYGIGFGYKYNFSFYAPSDIGSELYFPVNTRNFLIEPAFAIQQTEKIYSGDFTDSVINEEYSVGLFKKTRLSQRLKFYFGARIGIYKYSSTLEDSAGTYIAPILGFEHYFTRNISLGLDAGVRFVDSRGMINDKSTEISTTTSIILRTHF